MKLTLKKVLAVVAAAALLFSMAACGPKTVDVSSFEGLEITWYVPKMAQDDDAAVFEAANKIIGEKLGGLKVNFVPIDGGSYADKMNAKIGAGEQFDICYTCSWMNDYKGNVENEAFIALDDYNGENLLETYAPELWDMVPENIWNGTRIDGKIYGVPNYQVSTNGKSFWMDKALVEKYGFDISTISGDDWRSVEGFLELVKANDPDKFPTETNQIWGYAAACEGFVDGEVGGTGFYADAETIEYINEYATDEFKAYLATCKEWYDKGYVRSDIATVQDTQADKKAGRYASGWGTTKPGMESEHYNNYGQEIVTVKMTEDTLTAGSCIATMNAVSVTSKNPAAAVAVLNLVNTDVELYNILVHGLEGTHWEKAPELGENYIKVLDGATDRYAMTDWQTGCVFNGYLQEGQDPDVWEKTIAMNEGSVVDALFGFSLDQSSISTEVANINATRDKYLSTLEFGVSKDMDGDLAAMLAELEKAGMGAVLDEMNFQVEAWLAAK